MLGESLAHNIAPNVEYVVNYKPAPFISYNVGVNKNKTRQALRKGGKKRNFTTSSLQQPHIHSQPPHQKSQVLQRSNPQRLADHNHNNVAVSLKSSWPSHPDLAIGRTQSQAVLTLHLKQGTRKELIKSKSGKFEGGSAHPVGQSLHSYHKHKQVALNLKTRCNRSKNSNVPGHSPSTYWQDNSFQQKLPSVLQSQQEEEKQLFSSTSNVDVMNVCSELVPDELKDGEKIYAGAKFSEPPSPSVLPKPPSHWVGGNGPQPADHSREEMTVYLKSLLNVQNKS